MKLNDNMFAQKDGFGQTVGIKQQKDIYSGQTASSWKETNNSNDWKNIGGYCLNITENSAWSRSDSAASMFALTPGWEEDFQDLSPYCRESMLSAKENVTKSTIVQDDELNTPEICIQKFDYPTRGNVSRDDTSPMSLFEGGMWDIPPLINVSKQAPINEKEQEIITSNEVAEYSISDEKYIQTDEVISNQLKSDVEVFIDEIPIVGHEEEITSAEDVIIDDLVTHDIETESVLVYDKKTETMQFLQSAGNTNEVTMSDSDRETDLEADLIKIESLLAFGKVQTSNFPIQDVNHDEIYAGNVSDTFTMELDAPLNSNLDTKFENSPHEDIATSKQININAQMTNERNKLVTKQKSIASPVRNSTAQLPVQNVEKPNLHLNLAAVLGEDDLISTPVILESLLGEEVSFETLLDFVQPDVQDIKPELSTVDFSEVSALPSNLNDTITSSNETKDDDSLDDRIVKPVIIKVSEDGKLHVTHKEESDKQIKIEERKRSGKQKRSVKTAGKNKTILKAKVEDRSDLTDDGDSDSFISSSSSRSTKIPEKEIAVRRPRGRPPQEQSASSSKIDASFTSRLRKTSYRSDFEDISSPPSKRSRQSSIESESDKYRELRDRNNEASRKSRLNRKTRETEMKIHAENLQKENQSLRIKAEEMERLVKKLRQALLEAVTKGKAKNT